MMKIKVIVNPQAGTRTVQKELERIIGRLLISKVASRIDVTPTTHIGHATEIIARLTTAEYDLVLGCGGDGTINEIINGLIQGQSHIPLAILAAGTSNDFAHALHLPGSATRFCQMVEDGCYRDIDVGCANGRYFINVASFGMFTRIAHNTDQTQKNMLGLLAYYLQGVRSAPQELTETLPISIRSQEYTDDGDYLVCLVVNSTSVGSMRKLMRRADVSDGLFDVLLLKIPKLAAATPHLTAVKKAEEPVHDTLVHYFQTAHITFTPTSDSAIATDLDGESFGYLPLTVDVAPKAIRLLVPAPKQPKLLRLPMLL